MFSKLDTGVYLFLQCFGFFLKKSSSSSSSSWSWYYKTWFYSSFIKGKMTCLDGELSMHFNNNTYITAAVKKKSPENADLLPT